MADIVEDIKNRLDIVEVVSDYVQLKKAGRNFKALSPFKKERTPSFVVSPDKQLAYCFSTQKGGDMIQFIMDVENVDFKAALAHLAQKAGIEYEPTTAKGPQIPKDVKEGMYLAHTMATEFYAKALAQDAKAKAYVDGRALTEETIATFQLGYAPASGSSLWKHLQASFGSRPGLLLEAGLLSKKQGYYDKFRDRIIFPIHNTIGNVVAFAGRVLGDGTPKYLNSPESPIYNKSALVYGLHLAKEHIRKEGCVIIVEGYMDVISAHQAGIRNIVATCGTALTADQVRVLKRFAPVMYFLFDEDEAGWQATLRNGELALKEEVEVQVISLGTDAKDVDDFVQEHSLEEFKERMSQAKPLFDYVLQKYQQTAPHTPDGQMRVVRLLQPLLHAVPSPLKKQLFIRQLALELGVEDAILVQEMDRKPAPRIHTEVSGPATSFTPEALILGVLLQYPSLTEEVREVVSYLSTEDPLVLELRGFILSEVDFDGEISEEVLASLSEDVRKRIGLLTVYVSEHAFAETEEEARKILKQKLKVALMQEQARVLRKLKQAEQQKDFRAWKELFDRMSKMQAFLKE